MAHIPQDALNLAGQERERRKDRAGTAASCLGSNHARDLRSSAGRDKTGSAGAGLPYVAGRGSKKLSVTFRYHVSNHKPL